MAATGYEAPMTATTSLSQLADMAALQTTDRTVPPTAQYQERFDKLQLLGANCEGHPRASKKRNGCQGMTTFGPSSKGILQSFAHSLQIES